MKVFVYGETEIKYLKSKDKKLAAAIEKIGLIKRETNEDIFISLVYSIVGQQISTKAQKTICNRFFQEFGFMTPKIILDSSVEKIQSLGISYRKAEYIYDLAKKIYNNEISINNLQNLSDNEISNELVKLKGIGEWTSEMIMLFSMQRKNIFSYKDLAIHRGLRMLYGHKEVTKEYFEKYRKRFTPYCSVASLYLWEIAGGALPELKDKSKIIK